MAWRFKTRGSDGRTAIYEPGGAGSEDDVFNNPAVDYSRVLFHSNIDYPRVVQVMTGTLNIPASSGATSSPLVITIGAHGLGAIPLVTGRWFNITLLGGVDMPACGSCPVQYTAPFRQRWITLGADVTNVKVLVHRRDDTTLPGAINIDYEILVMTPTLGT